LDSRSKAEYAKNASRFPANFKYKIENMSFLIPCFPYTWL
jgi:hypothetical protein